MRGDEFFEEIASRPPLTKLHPRVASFLKTYLAGEKVIPFGGLRVINTQGRKWGQVLYFNIGR